ncbi:monosaccharide ABC transporter membrane protein (CUT2 family) [Anaerobacterium chartisolvens]|uniref:Monosaccharide ABC transporter membrane protein (CUT2 family) n=1 Tax=Anaerobacterium chartisolvens TaxID=1297424 RepID=A0A369B318_9FIRM|nr:ABC transporter permease [Anaerobacterium chartisolvens]RCX14846.1 monosaccharide ABC transporter membrane protein (CUT2 family) [Anaerobacterium chartisolvens]
MHDRLKLITKSKLFWPLMILVLMIIFNIIFVDDFLSIEFKDGHLFGRIIDIINRAAPLMLLAMGMTLVIATGGVDLSVGSTAAISGALVCSLIGGNFDGTVQNPFIIAIIAALFVSILAGAWNGFLVGKLGIQPVVATLILYVAGRGIAQLITGGQIITVYYKPYAYLGGFAPGIPIPFSIIIAAVVLVIVLLALKKTALGLFIESVGVNSVASRFTGISVVKIKFLVYAFSGLCAGIAGLIISSMIRAADANNAGLMSEMDAILAVAIGGTSMAGGRFSLGASMIGALIVQSITTTLYAVGVSAQVLPLIKAIVVIAICFVQSEELRHKLSGIFSKIGGARNEKATVKL